MQPSEKSVEIIYVADPMCSWCWGFTPVLDRILNEFGQRTDFRIVVGGLRPGALAQKMNDSVKAYIKAHWQHVNEATGQAFDFSFFDRKDFLYDTEPPARAVVTVRSLAPQKELAFFNSLQRAFYADNVDITSEKNYTSFLQRHEISQRAFAELFHSDPIKRATYQDFQEAQALGIRGFPSVVLRKRDELVPLTTGYQPYENLTPVIERFLASN